MNIFRKLLNNNIYLLLGYMLQTQYAVQKQGTGKNKWMMSFGKISG